jgi:hypothetical protein
MPAKRSKRLAFEEFDITIPADSFTREQIAGVTIHWSVLELMVERVIAHLRGKGGIVEYAANLEIRVRYLKKLVKKSVLISTEQRKVLLAVCSLALQLRSDRDRVVHGLWSRTKDGHLLSFHPWAKGKPTRPLDAKQVRRIKLQIFALHRKLDEFVDQTLPAQFFGRQRSST